MPSYVHHSAAGSILDADKRAAPLLSRRAPFVHSEDALLGQFILIGSGNSKLAMAACYQLFM